MTIKELNEKRGLLNIIGGIGPGSKLSIAVIVAVRKLAKNMAEATSTADEVLIEKQNTARIMNAICDEAGALLTKEDRYQYTPEGMVKLQKDLRAAAKEYEAVTVDVAPAKMLEMDVPKDLDPFVIEGLIGLLF